MKTRSILMAALLTTSSMAGDLGVFVADDSGRVFSSYSIPATSSQTNACADVGTNTLYRVVVTEAEYTAGWGVLPQARKEVAKAKAAAERADMDGKMDKLVKAFALVVLDEINTLRAKQGLAPRTAEQLKTAVKTKFESLP
jgi:hypothetical protein